MVSQVDQSNANILNTTSSSSSASSIDGSSLASGIKVIKLLANDYNNDNGSSLSKFRNKGHIIARNTLITSVLETKPQERKESGKVDETVCAKFVEWAHHHKIALIGEMSPVNKLHLNIIQKILDSAETKWLGNGASLPEAIESTRELTVPPRSIAIYQQEAEKKVHKSN